LTWIMKLKNNYFQLPMIDPPFSLNSATSNFHPLVSGSQVLMISNRLFVSVKKQPKILRNQLN
jgi:hypothetical protein